MLLKSVSPSKSLATVQPLRMPTLPDQVRTNTHGKFPEGKNSVNFLSRLFCVLIGDGSLSVTYMARYRYGCDFRPFANTNGSCV
jgi:hypothetical protein